MQYELVQDASTWLIILSLLLELQCLLSFLSMHIDCYRHQRSPKQQASNKVSQQSSQNYNS